MSSLGWLVAVLSTLMACASPAAPNVVHVTPSLLPSSVPEPEPVDALMAPPARGRAGWFEVHEEAQRAYAVEVEGGGCIAISNGRRWSVTPDDTVQSDHPTPCDGNARDPIALDRRIDEIHVLGRGLAYSSATGKLWIAEAPDSDPVPVQTPFDWSDKVATTGAALLAKSEGELHRFDGQAWTRVRLDGDKVKNFVTSPDGGAYVTTSKNALFKSTDSGSTWTKVKIGLVEMTWLYVAPDGPSQGNIVLRGRFRPKANGPLEDGLATLGPVRMGAFPGATIRIPLPEGVTDPNGVPLVARRGAIESLTAGRKCIATDVLDSFAAAACVDGKELFIVASDDLGMSLKEIYREPLLVEPSRIVVAPDEILMLYPCREPTEDPEDLCRRERASVVRRGKKAWTKEALDLPDAGWITTAGFDRKGGGGFYLVTTSRRFHERAILVEGVVFHTRGDRVTRQSITPFMPNPGTAEKRHSSVLAASVNDDGGLSLVVEGGADSKGHELRYLRLSDRLVVVDDRAVLLKPEVRYTPRADQMAVVDARIVIADWENDALVVSSNEGATFERVRPRSMNGLTMRGNSRLVCGRSGCDVGTTREGGAVVWR